MNVKYPKVNLPVYPIAFETKPSNGELRKINHFFSTHPSISLSADEIAYALTNGHTIRVSEMSGAKNNDFIQSQIIGIDFDNDCKDISEIINQLLRDGIGPSFVYKTFSFTEQWQKYRAIWILDKPISEPALYKYIVSLLIRYFGSSPKCKLKPNKRAQYKIEGLKEYCSNGQKGTRRQWYRCFRTLDGRAYYIGPGSVADTSCSNVDRIYFGTTGGLESLVYQDFGATVNAQYLAEVCTRTIKTIDVNYNRTLRECAAHIAGARPDYLTSLGVSLDEKVPGLILYIRRTKNSSSDTPKPLKETTKANKETKREERGSGTHIRSCASNITSDELKSTCKLFRKGLTKKLSRKMTFGLITNLCWMSQDIQQTHKVCLSKLDKGNVWNSTYRAKYNPMDCHSFCPYADKCNPIGQLLTKSIQSIQPQYFPSEMSGYKMEPVAFVRHILSNTLSQCIESPKYQGKIHIIAGAQCGIGKTEAYLQYIQDNLSDNITVAMPTHKLKDEIIERNQSIVHSISPRTITPELPAILEISTVKQLYDAGAYKLAKSILEQYPEGRKYIEDKSRKLKGLTFTTHDKVLCSPTHNPVIIFDEDPIHRLINVKTVSLKDIRNFESFYGVELDIQRTDRLIHKSSVDIKLFINNYLEFVLVHKPETNVLDFLVNAEYYISKANYNQGKARLTDEILYVSPKRLPDTKTIIILSATVNPDLYKAMYGEDRVVVHSLPQCQEQAQVIQDARYSMSRSSITKHAKFVDYLTKQSLPVVTYLPITAIVNANQPLPVVHIGNSEGYDTLNDKSFIVAGKAVLNPETCQLIVKSIDPDYPITDISKSKQTIKYCGLRKDNYYTYRDPRLRQIDLWFTGSALKQVVGRIRPLSSKNTVYIYNDFPYGSYQTQKQKPNPELMEW